jgi:signal transduction histidine kinase
MIEFQRDHEHIAALLELMAATDAGTDPRTIAERAVEWLLARDSIAGVGIWVDHNGNIQCLAYQNIDPDQIAPQIRQVLAASASVETAQTPHLTTLLLKSAGKASGVLAVVTHAPVASDELLLLRAVAAHLGSALAAVRQSQSEREWQAFISHAAHEIKNPLAAIKGYADLLLRRAAKDPADPYRKGLSTISSQVVRTTALLEQLSDITRIDTGSLTVDRHAGDFGALVGQVVQEYQAGDHASTIVLDAGAPELPSLFDRIRLRQVVSAMIGNAIKFSPDGGTINVSLRQSQADRAPVALLSVSDTGVGVPAGEEERVFERFFRGSNIQGTYAGLGLGLYIARNVLDLHGGRIWLESQRGQGTTCHVALPLAS